MRVRVPPPAHTVQTLLDFADELEQRDADVAQRLLDVERLQRDVEELRTQAAAVAAFLAALPATIAAFAADEEAARAARGDAATSVREAEAALAQAKRDDERLAAERDLRQAADDLHAVERWVAETQAARSRAERDAAVQRAEAERLAGRALELARAVPDVGAPGPGLEGALAWASQARGVLLLERSGLAREREAVVREASELLGSVAGEPLALTSVAGLRDRLSRALT
jgi:chromosome segregation ATPase